MIFCKKYDIFVLKEDDFMFETESLEFKEQFDENKILKEIVGFLNSKGGTILVGYNDDGKLVGLDDIKKKEELISNKISAIEPDASVFININTEVLDNKSFLNIKVVKGTDVYYLREKGINKGTYIRNGSCTVPATKETIKQLFIQNSTISFETTLSAMQDLTFEYAKNIFELEGININDETIQKNLKLKNNEGYTILALIISDQNPFPIRIAVYENEGKSNFLDRRELTGSIFKIYDDALNYLKLNTQTYGIINSTIRTDISSYPEFILREALLNSIIHRDYSNISANIINIYQDKCIEIISYGSLVGNITKIDILNGTSISRNPYLQSIFLRLRRVEAIGSGIKRINTYYQEFNIDNFDIKVLPASFILKLPKITYEKANELEDEEIILNNLNEPMSREEISFLINKKKTATSNLLNRMVSIGKIEQIGSGPSTKYIRKEV